MAHTYKCPFSWFMSLASNPNDPREIFDNCESSVFQAVTVVIDSVSSKT